MTEEVKTEFRKEGEPAFQTDKEKDNSGDSSPEEETDTDQTLSSEEDKNQTDKNKDDGEKKDLDDHPRWREREADWKRRFNKQEERQTEEIAKLREEFEDKIGKVKPKESEKLPSWFGGDEMAWEEYQRDLDERIGKAKEGAVKEITAKSEAEQKAIDEATTYFRDEVATIESDKDLNPGGQKVDRNKLLKFVLDNDLVDSKGRWNYKAGYKLMKAGMTSVKDKGIDEKKKIAGATTDEHHAEDKPKAFKTSEDFKNPQERPW